MDLDQNSFQKFYYGKNKEQYWFPAARYGVFIHWGAFSATGRGEQALFRDHMDMKQYTEDACHWNPSSFDAEQWAIFFEKAGFRYACLTTRHHDGYCLWDTKTTNYSSAKQAPKRDLVREYCEAMRRHGIKVGLYYSWCDWRIPAYYLGPGKDPEGWAAMKKYIHDQVEELCTQYGQISYFFFDGVWPRNAKDLGSQELTDKMRRWQPGILINNRLGFDTDPAQLLKHGGGNEEGDFGTPERLVTPENRLWESCQVSTWRWWGYHAGERWRSAEELLDALCTCACTGGNLLINVGPDPDGVIPKQFCDSMLQIGKWLNRNGEALFAADGGGLTESLTYGYQTIHGENLYLIMRLYDGKEVFRLADLINPVRKVVLLGEKNSELTFRKEEDVLLIDLPADIKKENLFPVLRIECEGVPETNEWGRQRLWEGDPLRIADWAQGIWDANGFNV